MSDSILDDASLEESSGKDNYTIIPHPNANARISAFLVDAFLVYAVFVLLNLVSFLVEDLYFYMYPSWLLIPLYKTWMEGRQGATIGKKMLYIKIVKHPTWRVITYKEAIGRNFLLWLFFMIIVVYKYCEISLKGFWFEAPWYWKVPQLIEQVLPWYCVFLFLCWFVLLFSRPPRAPYDYWAGTVAIHSNDQNKP